MTKMRLWIIAIILCTLAHPLLGALAGFICWKTRKHDAGLSVEQEKRAAVERLRRMGISDAEFLHYYGKL